MEDKSDFHHNLREDGFTNKRSTWKSRSTRRAPYMFASVGRKSFSMTINTPQSDQKKDSSSDFSEEKTLDGHDELAEKQGSVQVNEEPVSSEEEDTFCGEGDEDVSSGKEITFCGEGDEDVSSGEAEQQGTSWEKNMDGTLTSNTLEAFCSSYSKMEDKSDHDCSLCEDGISNKLSVQKRRSAQRAPHISASVAGESTNTASSDQTKSSNSDSCQKETLNSHDRFLDERGNLQVKEELVSSGEEDTFSEEGDPGNVETVIPQDSTITQRKQGQDMLKFNIGRSKEISEDLRKQVIEAHKNGKGYKRIAKDLDLHQSTVRQIVHKWKKFSTVATLPRSGRPTKIGAKARSAILKHMTENTRVTAKDLKASLALDNINVHESTIRKTLNKWCSWDFTIEEATQRAPHISASDVGESINTAPSDQTKSSNSDSCQKETFDSKDGFLEEPGNLQVKEDIVSTPEEDTFSEEGDPGNAETVIPQDPTITQHKQGQDMLKFNVGRSKEISEDLRKQVVEAHKNGKGYKRIAKDLDLHPSTVRQIIYKWKKFSTVATLPRSGRPTKIGAKARSTILKHMTENTRVTAKDLKASLALDNINVHVSTIRKNLNKWCSWDFTNEEATALQLE